MAKKKLHELGYQEKTEIQRNIRILSDKIMYL